MLTGNINWKSILKDIYCPTIGSLWVAPNGIWNNSFAHNKASEEFHPSVVGRVYVGLYQVHRKNTIKVQVCFVQKLPQMTQTAHTPISLSNLE